MCPSGLNEVGPSNWMDRNLEMDQHGMDMGRNIVAEAEMHHNSPNSPTDLGLLSNIITNRFRISPLLFADVFNLFLQEQPGIGVRGS